MNEIWEERAKKPKSFDVISIMAHGEATSKMTLRQRMGILILFLVGGNDTTRNSMSGGLLGAAAASPISSASCARTPIWSPARCPEIVRWQTPVIHMRRTALEDAEIGGKPIKAGDKVVVWYISGNRDEEHIERAERVHRRSQAAARAHVVRLRHPSLPGQPPGGTAVAHPVGGDPAPRPADRGAWTSRSTRTPTSCTRSARSRSGSQPERPPSPSPCGRGLGEGPCQSAITNAAASDPAPWCLARPPDWRSQPRGWSRPSTPRPDARGRRCRPGRFPNRSPGCGRPDR